MRSLIVALLCALSTAASAEVQTNIGILTCTLAPAGDKGVTPPSQTRAMTCAFKPNGSGPEERYSGEIQKVGSQTALSGEMVQIWVVMGPDRRPLEPGLLQQTYVGKVAAAPDAKVQSPKILVGETDDAFALRPMSDDPSDNNAAGSVTVVVLKVKSIPS
jgi:Protein of unknown function (DUF992)